MVKKIEIDSIFLIDNTLVAAPLVLPMTVGDGDHSPSAFPLQEYKNNKKNN